MVVRSVVLSAASRVVPMVSLSVDLRVSKKVVLMVASWVVAKVDSMDA